MKKAVVLLFSSAVCSVCVHAADLYVSNYGGDIQAAVDAAASNDTVWVEDGTYLLSSEILVANAITVRGINGPAAAIVDGDESVRCFYLENEGCILADLTIQNGYTDENGAGVYCDYESIVVSNCVIRSNAAQPDSYAGGGGLHGGTAIDCLIENNTAMEGGGAIYTILVNCHVEGNVAGWAGGESEGRGGGLAYGFATNCIIINNTAFGASGGEVEVGGGGLYESSAYTCAISGNETTGNGGGAYYGSLYNCTITANTANLGGGVYSSEMYNCIVWHNIMTGSGDGGGPEFESEGPAPMAASGYVSGTDVYGGWSIYYSCAPELEVLDTGNITNDPVLVSYSHIATNSPCIGAGTTNLTYDGGGPAPMAFGEDPEMTATDIDGETWLIPPSMGCDENHGSGTLVGSLELSIEGPTPIATEYAAEYHFMVDGIPSLVVAVIEGVGSFTNPVGVVEAAWSTPGTNDVVLTAYNETHPGGVSITQEVVVVSAAASAIHVSTDGADANDGSSWALAKETIQGGIDAQPVLGGWVLVADGTYDEEMYPVFIERPMTVKGTNAVPAAIIDADESNPCVAMFDNGAVLQSFIVQNGYAWGSGAGIDCQASGATVRNCIIRDNYSDYTGGGMSGGNAINCGFYNNIADSDGAALYQGRAIGCAIAYNESYNGSAAVCFGELRNCTVVANHAAYRAGGAYECDLFNSIVWHNTCDNPSEGSDIAWGNYWINVCSPDVDHGIDGCITNEPMLASSSHLAAGSPCIGAGDAAEALEADIDGQAWLTPPSIGCDEPYSPVTGEIAVSISGITNCAEGTTADYSFVAIGPATQTVADFGDGMVVTNPVAQISKVWNTAGLYDLVLTAWNDSYPAGVSVTQQVEVLSLAASTIHVALGGNDAKDGSDWANAKLTIQGGVDAQLVYGGRVLVSNGTYAVALPVSVDSPMKLVGFGGRDETIIDGGGTSQCLLLSDSHSYVEGFCITNAYGNYGGGVVCNSDNGPVITNCLITGCDADRYGGGGYYGTYIDCIISDNEAGSGGGLYGAVAINCLISGNEATKQSNSNGGGATSCSLYQCILKDNECTVYGGGAIYGESYSCLFVGNHARYGGGVRYGDHYNATITSNTCTSGSGGAHYAYLYNSIVYGNFRYSSPNDITGSSVYHTCSPSLTPGVNGNITDDPLFVEPANGDYRLSAGSPCIDAGDNGEVFVIVDLNGNQRIVNGTVDMGAYEYAATGPLDSDGDGMSDADELIAGTGVYDSNDWFRVASVSNAPSGTTVTWDWVADRLYSIYWTDDLVGQPFIELTNGLIADGFEDTLHTGDTNGFYLLKVELAP